MTIRKIVITGGPCAGKTTALSWIANNLPQKGYTVLFVPETATELIGGGLTPWGCGTNLDYQRCQMELQLTKERLFERGGRTIDADKLLSIMQMVASVSNDTTLATIGELSKQYDGVKIGFDMKK